MFGLFALHVALAAPEGIDADEADVWEARWSEIHTGPPGCWEVVGRATWSWDAGRMGSSRGSSAFVGILEDGVWRDAFIRSLGERVVERGETPITAYPHGEYRFVPLVGRPSSKITQSEELTENALVAIIDELGGDVLTSWSDWSDERDGVVLHREIPVQGGGHAKMDVLFPDGTELPSRLDLVFDEPFPLPDAPLVKIREAEAHIRARHTAGFAFPEAESLTFSASVFGFRAYGAQTIRYTNFRPCGGSAEASTAPLGG